MTLTNVLIVDPVEIHGVMLNVRYPHADKEFGRKWVAELRSGRMPQGRGRLRADEGGYCCLGVGAEVYNPNGWYGDSWAMDGDGEPDHFHADSGEFLYNDEVWPQGFAREVLGVHDMNVDTVPIGQLPLCVDPANGHETATSLNDDHEWDFHQIADAIEWSWMLTTD